MGQGFQAEVANGKRNLWGEKLFFIEPESEHSSASVCEGFAAAGGRITNFTSGQGLILMKEVLYAISGKRLPVVFHIGARALTSHSLNVHAGHDDVMGVADCGWGIIFARNAQEVADLTLIAHRAAENSETPFLMVQDGFLTTHTIENILLPEPELMKQFIGDPKDKLRNYLNPEFPLMIGVVQNQDSYMKGKIAQRYYYDKVPGAIKEAMETYYKLTGRRYDFIDGYMVEDAEYVVVGMGSYMETAMATVDYLRKVEGLKVGVLTVTVFAPFPGREIVRALKHVKALAVLERMDSPLLQSNPLTMAVKASFADAMIGAGGYPKIDRIPKIFSGAGGLGSRDVRPGDFIAIFKNMMRNDGKEFFVVGIKHELALKREHDPDIRPEGAFSMRGHSVGGYGSVTTNKIIATLLGDIFNLQVQAYPKYGSEKKGLPTTYYLTAARERIRMHCELTHVEFVPMNDVNAFNLGNPLAGLKDGGMIFIQSDKINPEDVWDGIPTFAKKIIRDKRIKVYYLDTIKIAREVAPTPDLEQRMQGIVLLGVFLRVTPFRSEFGMSEDELFKGVERSIRKYFGKRGETVVRANLEAVRRGYYEVMEVPVEIIEKGEVRAGFEVS
jgi:pyruvate-ferredoxin/flavodoxin oxidoreductase